MNRVYVGLDLGSSNFHQVAIEESGAITHNSAGGSEVPDGAESLNQIVGCLVSYGSRSKSLPNG